MSGYFDQHGGHPSKPVSRRSFLSVGALGVAGMGLADVLRAQAGAAQDKFPSSARAVITIYLAGGASHYETYDPKPEAPDIYRGEFETIPTNVPGVFFSELLPRQAEVMDKMAIIRSLRHKHGGHIGAQHKWTTGYGGANDQARAPRNPSLGSITAKVLGANRPGVPAYAVAPSRFPFDGPVYLGGAYGPFVAGITSGSLNSKTDKLEMPGTLTAKRLHRRLNLLGQLDQVRREIDQSGRMEMIDVFDRRALELVTGDAARKAFDISSEKPAERDRYGRTVIGQSMLLARRLVESGVTCVTVNSSGWDNHERLIPDMRKQIPPLDQAIAALITDLDQRGLLDQVMVCLFTDFGRDQMNTIGGRHHWCDCGSAMLAGGNIKLGQVVGASDRNGRFPIETPLKPEDVLTTVYRHLKINLNSAFPDLTGRPTSITNGGLPIKQLI